MLIHGEQYSNTAAEQLLLIDEDTTLYSGQGIQPERLGTFQDSLRAPVHRWFKYPAGFSYKLVEALIEDYRLGHRSWLLDPFVGCGTTAVVAKQQGVNCIGVEAHPFVHWVARVKCFWEYDLSSLRLNMNRLLLLLQQAPPLPSPQALEEFPDLVRKCYSPENLWALKQIRDTILTLECPAEERDFFLLALTDTLRSASRAGTGWPYIAPSKYHEKTERPAQETFAQTLQNMFRDLTIVLSYRAQHRSEIRLLLMDARDVFPVEPESIDLGITSPPYLNNYDYADRTRLEMYFFGWAKTWRDITEQVRDRLIVSATTQIRRSDVELHRLSPELQEADVKVYYELSAKIAELSRRRKTKGGKKNYDLMVVGYFNDMLRVLKQVYRVLKPGAPFFLVLGDSAPYGVYIPTEEYLGRLAVGIGFTDFHIQPLRARGTKWKNNPQRHDVGLKEGILILKK
ncbi:MAG: DNA methyltransferase [Armatimonadota bacterium]|nr:DNA methyltransferase [Armatimonadota bacterium]